jgi:hypothetical protein
VVPEQRLRERDHDHGGEPHDAADRAAGLPLELVQPLAVVHALPLVR